MEETEVKVEDLIQTYGDDDILYEGVITAVIPPKRERPRDYWNCTPAEQEDFLTFITVKYDDGDEETVNCWDVSPRDSEIEREFRLAAPDVLEKINEYLQKADAALDKAVALSEKHGIPFSSGISPLSQSYLPGSFAEKFPGVSRDIMSSVADASNEYEGWEHSAVCY